MSNEQRLKDIISDTGNLDKSAIKYIRLKGFLHIWTYFRTEKGQFICSYYKREKCARIATIRNSPECWIIHLIVFIGADWKSYFQETQNLKDAEEACNMFLDDKLVLD